jgi:hypothetical protein
MDPVELITLFTACVSGFYIADSAVEILSLKSPYYLIHSVHNAYIVWITGKDVLQTFTNFAELPYLYKPNYQAAAVVAALHVYHILLYRKKFRLDDWLHHILMIFVALPIGVCTPSSTLLGYSLFFSTGLPGGIDYALLFMNRNGWLSAGIEKRVNRWLNVWIRSPGCASHAALSVVYALRWSGSVQFDMVTTVCMLLPAILMYWNGQYFMEQVVANEERYRLEEERHTV